jgi:hypothetical protein
LARVAALLDDPVFFARSYREQRRQRRLADTETPSRSEHGEVNPAQVRVRVVSAQHGDLVREH